MMERSVQDIEAYKVGDILLSKDGTENTVIYIEDGRVLLMFYTFIGRYAHYYFYRPKELHRAGYSFTNNKDNEKGDEA